MADARNLRRALMLTSQIAGFGLPMVLVLNMVDEASRHGIDVDAAALADELGVPVVETVAIDGRGLDDLQAGPELAAPARVPFDRSATAGLGSRAASRLRRAPASIGRVQEYLARGPAAVDRPPILAFVLYVVYLFVGVFGAQTLVSLIEHRLFEQYINPAATALVTRFVPCAAGRDFLVGPYGLITMGLTYAIAIVLPVVATFFLIFGWLEDSGYIPRLADLQQSDLPGMGLNGKAVLPMVLGPRLRHDGHHDDADPRHAEGAADRRPPAGARRSLLGAAGDDPRYPRRISFCALLTLFGVVLVQMFLVGFLAARVYPANARSSSWSCRRSAAVLRNLAD